MGYLSCKDTLAGGMAKSKNALRPYGKDRRALYRVVDL